MQIAFQFKKGSARYNAFFAQQNEKKHVRELSIPFIDEHFEKWDKRGYLITERLTIQLTASERHRFANQLMKATIVQDGEEYWRFKKNSEMNLLWVEKVYSHVDTKALHGFSYWHLDFHMFGGGRTEILPDGDNLYGMIYPSDEMEKLTIPEWATEIKLSEYYALCEKLKEKNEKS